MRWVFHSAHVGFSRRQRSQWLRLFERRHIDHLGPAPALMTAFRQLRLAAAALSAPASFAGFADHADSVAVLALAAGRNGPAKALHALADRLRGPRVAAGHELAAQVLSELQQLEVQICHEGAP